MEDAAPLCRQFKGAAFFWGNRSGSNPYEIFGILTVFVPTRQQRGEGDSVKSEALLDRLSFSLTSCIFS